MTAMISVLISALETGAAATEETASVITGSVDSFFFDLLNILFTSEDSSCLNHRPSFH